MLFRSEHRWFMAEREHRQISIDEAVQAYIRDVLSNKPDEAAVFGGASAIDDTMEMPTISLD